MLVIIASGLVMVFLARRALRGMNQQDWILLRQVRSRGVDVRLPQAVSFMVFAASEEAGAQLAGSMQAQGYQTAMKKAQIQFARNRAKPGTPQDGWIVSGTRSVLLVPETLKEIRKTLTEMAAERKALYLGWQLADAAAPINAPAQPKSAPEREARPAERQS